MSTTRERSLDAAVDLAGVEGLRALTHARVDERAGLPRGSTSNWFRTRSALLSAVVVRIAESERADFTASAPLEPRTADDLAAAMTRMVELQTGPYAARSRARYALFLDAASDAELLAPLLEQRAAFENWVAGLLEHLDAGTGGDAVRTLMAGLEGIVLHRLTVDPAAAVAPVVARLVQAALPQ